MVRTGKRRATKGKRADGPSKDAKVVVYLAERALNGDQRGLHHLTVSNKESRSDALEADRDGCSLAMAWSAEPEWQGESSETVSETAGGSREPEGHAD
jgi:hypothetical protein